MNAKWHCLRERALKSLTSLMGRTSTFGSSRWRWCWPPWTFGRLSTSQRRLHHPMRTPKSSRSTNDAQRRPCPPLPSIWWMVEPHQEVQGTGGGMEDTLQRPRNTELVQHPLHSLQVLHVQDARGRRPSRPYQQR